MPRHRAVLPDSAATVVELAHALARGDTSVQTIAETCLARVEAAEPAVRAWAHLDPARVRARAAELDEVPLAARSPLHGIPLGVKDIFDTHDMPTEHGSPIYRHHQPPTDAASVAIARERGALVFGKLVTTEFAAWPPGPTTNPHDVTRTPGGSSSGPAAAVAAGMVPVAFATQTTGSIARPAAFCGVVGYKPTYGMLPCVGVKAISETFDTVGVMTRTVEDAAFTVGALAGRALTPPPGLSPPRLGVCVTHEWTAAAAETVALFDALPERLESGGARPVVVTLPPSFAGLVDAQSRVWTFEIARCLADEYRRFPEMIREPLRGMLEEGARMSLQAYEDSRHLVRDCQAELDTVFRDVDVLITPSAPGEAPTLATTGDPIFNRAWSALGVPVVNVPAGTGPLGLPLGVQIVGKPRQDALTLAAAAWVEGALGARRSRLPA